VSDSRPEESGGRLSSVAGTDTVVDLSDRFGGPGADEVVSTLRERFPEIKAVVSWRGVVRDSDVCPVHLALSYLDLVQEESCGRCGPCRIGTDILRRIFLRLKEGRGEEGDLERMRELVLNADAAAWCGIADTLQDPILALLDSAEEHLVEHMSGLTCEQPETTGWVTAPCRSTCPSGVDCPSYIFQTGEEHPHLATIMVEEDNPLPAVIGRTCHRPCEANCTLAEVNEPIAINYLKRWSSDRARGIVEPSRGGTRTAAAGPLAWAPDEATETAAAGGLPGRRPSSDGQRVAVIGAGPAGLSAGYYLARRGFRPVIFESLPVPGGMLYVGIPEYRLPKKVLLEEVRMIEREGVEIRYEEPVGRVVAFSELASLGFGGTFIAVGAHEGKEMGIPGEELAGCMDAIDFLRAVALGKDVAIGDKVRVVGGGNSAIDAARTAVRLGSSDVKIVYRRAEEQMPANDWEIEEAREEGVEFELLLSPVRCDGDVCTETLVCQPMELGAPDESGRRRPIAADCDPYALEADTVIAAVGQSPQFQPFVEDPDLQLNKWGYIDVDPHTFMTAKSGVFLGGDALTGGASVIEAIRAGKTVASYMEAYLGGGEVKEHMEDRVRRLSVCLGAQESRYPVLGDGLDYGRREEMLCLAPDVRRRDFSATEMGFTDAQARREAKRCLRCHRPLLVAWE